MKKIIILLLMSSLFVEYIYSQNNAIDSTLIKYLRVDYAIPDQPAFKLLGTNPSDILRPSNTNELSAISSSFMEGSSIVIPKSFSLEVAPMLLAKSNKLTLSDYIDKKFLYRAKVSVGTQKSLVDTVEKYKIALGFRFTLIDNSDLKTNKNYINQIFDITAEKTEWENIYKIEYLKIVNKTILDYIENKALQDSVQNYIDKKITEKFNENYFDDRLEKLKEKFKQDTWNADKWDVALAFLTESPDSLAKNIQFTGVGVWTTYAHGFKNWGQLLIGASYNYLSFDSLIVATSKIENFSNHKLSVASRLYFGSNNFKGFLEGQFDYRSLNTSNNALINLGTEMNIYDGIWINLNVGYTFNDVFTENNSSNLFSSFDIRIQIPEKLKFF